MQSYHQCSVYRDLLKNGKCIRVKILLSNQRNFTFGGFLGPLQEKPGTAGKSATSDCIDVGM